MLALRVQMFRPPVGSSLPAHEIDSHTGKQTTDPGRGGIQQGL